MNKIKSLDDLRKMKQSLKSDISIREKSDKAEEMVRV
ncbi:MAG: (2Fe-2S) ferredoxin domain-containing protein, partial [Bacteroidales bacterium]|nr:(2Fe-2S) ferredoxin domain-containing protein [Bacteroidales bacterium]